mgnify:CR=1 FL=1
MNHIVSLIQPYQAKWAEDFRRLAKQLREALTGLPIRIEHVGSTSVVGLAAKPIIDIDIVFPQAESFDSVRAKLEAAGYYHNGNQGIIDREVFKRADFASHPVFDNIVHHLYVCSENSVELDRHLRFRDALKASAAARRAYEQLKLELAELAGQDRKLYAALKEVHGAELVEAILRGDFGASK